MGYTVVEHLINEQGLRIERVAVALDLSNAGVRVLLAQKSSPRLRHVMRLCELLGVGMWEIVGTDSCWRELEEMEDDQGHIHPVVDSADVKP